MLFNAAQGRLRIGLRCIYSHEPCGFLGGNLPVSPHSLLIPCTCSDCRNVLTSIGVYYLLNGWKHGIWRSRSCLLGRLTMLA